VSNGDAIAVRDVSVCASIHVAVALLSRCRYALVAVPASRY
jgi:hypothetical protein